MTFKQYLKNQYYFAASAELFRTRDDGRSAGWASPPMANMKGRQGSSDMLGFSTSPCFEYPRTTDGHVTLDGALQMAFSPIVLRA